MAEKEKKKSTRPPRTFWNREATTLLQSLLARRGMGYKALSTQLERIGVKENPRALCNKINRGAFSITFFLQCLHALGYSEVPRLDLSPRPKDSGTPKNR